MTIRIAFHGTGERAQPYLRALARRSDVELAAACDLDQRSAEQTAAGWGARAYVSYETMLAEAEPQALWVCVEPGLQADVLLRAAERRLPFFVVPPGAADFVRARAYAQAVVSARLLTAVGFPARHADVVREAREYVGDQPVHLAHASWLSGAADEPAGSALGRLWGDACHLLDALRFFCGEVVRVRALAPGGTAGGLSLQLEFARGTVGTLTCTTFARPQSRRELELLGDGWSLVFEEGLAALRLVEADRTTILRSLNDAAAEGTAEFLEAVATGTPPPALPDYADALRTLAICEAAARSLQEKRPVDIDPAGDPV